MTEDIQPFNHLISGLKELKSSVEQGRSGIREQDIFYTFRVLLKDVNYPLNDAQQLIFIEAFIDLCNACGGDKKISYVLYLSFRTEILVNPNLNCFLSKKALEDI